RADIDVGAVRPSLAPLLASALSKYGVPKNAHVTHLWAVPVIPVQGPTRSHICTATVRQFSLFSARVFSLVDGGARFRRRLSDRFSICRYGKRNDRKRSEKNSYR